MGLLERKKLSGVVITSVAELCFGEQACIGSSGLSFAINIHICLSCLSLINNQPCMSHCVGHCIHWIVKVPLLSVI